jgi:flagellar hook-associated protein 3 FlgL
MRVSERMRFDSTNNRIDVAKQFTDDVQQTAVSGRKLRRLSDGPADAVRVFRNRTKLENVAQFRKSLDFANGYLSQSEDSLRSIDDILIRSRELAIQLSNSTYSDTDRAAASEEVRQLMGQIVSIGNSTYADRYVFGGFRTATPPLAPDGIYSGDDGEIIVQLDENSFRSINMSGRKIFDVEAEREERELPLVKSVEFLFHALRENDIENVRNSVGLLDSSIARVVNATADLGAKRSAFSDLSGRLDKAEEVLLIDNNTLESADPIKAALDLKRAETTLQYTLQSSSKTLQPSLLQYLGN